MCVSDASTGFYDHNANDTALGHFKLTTEREAIQHTRSTVYWNTVYSIHYNVVEYIIISIFYLKGADRSISDNAGRDSIFIILDSKFSCWMDSMNNCTCTLKICSSKSYSFNSDQSCETDMNVLVGIFFWLLITMGWWTVSSTAAGIERHSTEFITQRWSQVLKVAFTEQIIMLLRWSRLQKLLCHQKEKKFSYEWKFSRTQVWRMVLHHHVNMPHWDQH